MPDEPSMSGQLSELEKIHENFRIVGGSNVTVEGSLKHGFAICSTCPGEDQGVSTLPVNVTNTAFGACCFPDGSCGVTNSSACTLSGGTYQGDGTDCDPNPCGGACCHGGICTQESEAGCADLSGTYFGVGSDCMDQDCTQGACCFNCDCYLVDAPGTDCTDVGGDYHGDGTTCSPDNPCPTNIPKTVDVTMHFHGTIENGTVDVTISGSQTLNCCGDAFIINGDGHSGLSCSSGTPHVALNWEVLMTPTNVVIVSGGVNQNCFSCAFACGPGWTEDHSSKTLTPYKHCFSDNSDWVHPASDFHVCPGAVICPSTVGTYMLTNTVTWTDTPILGDSGTMTLDATIVIS